MENSTLHFKMYKSGKNWMVAGLMTTAVLAGLTLGNVNTTEAHAAVNSTPVAAAQKTPATSAEVQSQQTVVNSAATAVNSQTAVVASASTALASAQNLNSASAAVSGAEAQWSAAEKNAESARQAMGSASQNSQKAAKELKGATNLQHGFWKSKGSAAYDYLTNLVANTQKELDEAQAELPAAQTAWDNANDARVKAYNSGMDQTSTAYLILKTNAEKAYNDLKAIKVTIKGDKATISDANAKLNGKAKLADGSKHNLIKNKALVDSIPALQEAAQKAHNAYVAASDAASDASVIAENALDNISAVRDAYNLPDSITLDQMHHDAMGAPRKINSDKTEINRLRTADQTYYGDAVKYASEAAVKEGQAESAVAKAKSDVATDTDQLEQAKAKQTTAQANYDANKTSLNLRLLKNAKALVDTWQGTLTAAKADLETANQKLTEEQKQVEYWNNQVKSTQATDRYQKLSADIVYRQGLIDAYNEANQNFKDAKSAAALVAPLQAAYDNANNVLTALKNTLAREQAKLAAMEGEQPAASYTVTPGGETVQPDHTIAKNPSTNVTVQLKGNAATVSVVNGKAIAAVEGNTQKVSVVSSEWTNGYDAAQAQVAKAQAELKAANQASKVIYISATYTLSDGSTVKADVPVTVLNNVTTNPDEGQTTDNNEGQGSFTGEKDGKYFVKGQQVSAYQYKEYVAAHPSAVKATAKKNAATKATAKKLPQTGNNSAAVVALGALSGMLGLGLAAKKREF